MTGEDRASAGADFAPAEVVRRAFGAYLAELFAERFPGEDPARAAFLRETAERTLALLGHCDALYHDAEHTMQVTTVGQHVLRGLDPPATPGRWMHVTVALLLHDVGYARGACAGDGAAVVTARNGRRTMPPRGASSAWLAPWHVERSVVHVVETLVGSPHVEAARVARAVEFTRFPPEEGRSGGSPEEDGLLVRAADLVGQLGDPRYPWKMAALYHEMAEAGQAAALGHRSPADLFEALPEFYAREVEPYLGAALASLARTPEGRAWIRRLNANVAAARDGALRPGPFPGPRPRGP